MGLSVYHAILWPFLVLQEAHVIRRIELLLWRAPTTRFRILMPEGHCFQRSDWFLATTLDAIVSSSKMAVQNVADLLPFLHIAVGALEIEEIWTSQPLSGLPSPSWWSSSSEGGLWPFDSAQRSGSWGGWCPSDPWQPAGSNSTAPSGSVSLDPHQHVTMLMGIHGVQGMLRIAYIYDIN